MKFRQEPRPVASRFALQAGKPKKFNQAESDMRLLVPAQEQTKHYNSTDDRVMLGIYKRGQGKHTRIATFLGVMLIGVIGAYALSEKLGAYVSTQVTVVRFGLPLLALISLGLLMFWMVNRPKSADFLIATEGEMKKVSWSSRKEISGSTKVVIVTTFILASILFGVDMMFTWLFSKLGIMGG